MPPTTLNSEEPHISLPCRTPGGRKSAGTKRSGTAPRTSPKARTRSDAAPPPKNARGIPQN